MRFPDARDAITDSDEMAIVIKVLLLGLSHAAAGTGDACIGFSDGGYTGDVTTSSKCQDACETAEGLPVGDLNTRTDTNGTYYSCKCASRNGNSRRNLCEDAGYEAAAPCFPSTSVVTLECGTAVPIHSLRAGDTILAAARDGRLYHDTVSRWSLVQNEAHAAFVELTTESTTLRLTAKHHLPVGADRALKHAVDVAVGDLIWLVSEDHSTLVARRVIGVDTAFADGLHNPLLVGGGMPIVDGVATASNSAPMMALAAAAVPLLEAACAATGTCLAAREAIGNASGAPWNPQRHLTWIMVGPS